MSEPDLTAQERLVLLALLVVARPVTNAELRMEAGLDLTGAPRRRLNQRKLVDSQRRGSAFEHELTDAGAVHCEQELLLGERPDRSGRYGGVLWATLASMHRLLRRSDMTLADAFRPDIEALVRVRYGRLAPVPGAPVRLSALRDAVNGAVTTSELDAELLSMADLPGVHLRAAVDQRSLTDHDRQSALLLGGEDRHNIQIEP